MKRTKYIRLLESIIMDDILLVGGKAGNLGEMIRAGLPVPGGFVLLTSSYHRFVEANHLEEQIVNLLMEVEEDDFAVLEGVANKIQDLFEKGEIPPDVQEALDRCYELFGKPPVAVRSSATAEDLPGTSFAGQYDTYLNVQGRQYLHKYVKRCWASLWNHRALSYRIKQNIGNKDLAHGVVVQKLINAEKSGILFTANPVNGRRDQMLLNSSWGLGEAIVGGEVTPDQWVIDKTNGKIVEEIIGSKEVMTIRKRQGIELIKVAEEKQIESTLTETEVQQLLQLGLEVERYFGSPQDIEWAYADGKFYLVQSRPITSLYPMVERRDGKNGLRIHINMGMYSQAMKEPFTPMGENVIREMVRGTVTRLSNKECKREEMWWLQSIGGRLFIDITDFMRTEKSWGKFKKEDPNDKDPITTKALLQLLERNKDEIIDPQERVKLFRMINLNLVRFLVNGGIKYCYGIISPVKAREKAVLLGEETVKQIKNARRGLKTTEEKLDFISRSISDLVMSCAGLLFYVAVSSTYIEKAKKIIEQYLGDTSDLYEVEKSVPYSVTTEMGMEILRLAEAFDEKGKRPSADDKEMMDFMDKYGHRSSIELDVGVPAWKEQPQYVIDLVNTYIENKNYQQGMDRFYQGKEEAERAIQTIRRRLEEKGERKKARKVERLLRDFREMFGIRELSKFVITQVFSIYRDMLLEVGEELEQAGRIYDRMDIFYVTMEDIRTTKNLKKIVEGNKEQYSREVARTAPRLLTSTGESIYSALKDQGENALLGIPVSPGVYEGKVKVLKTPEEGHRLEKGDILVTTGTNPAWTPLFLKLGALIMETGGPISHGSVVAREYGVPAVAGVASATTVLKDGQMVRINGETGSVEIVEDNLMVG